MSRDLECQQKLLRRCVEVDFHSGPVLLSFEACKIFLGPILQREKQRIVGLLFNAQTLI